MKNIEIRKLKILWLIKNIEIRKLKYFGHKRHDDCLEKIL
jgi:hypothetical protein